MINSPCIIKKKLNKILLFNVFFMAILLNQTSVIFGVNISIADFFAVIIVLILILRNKLFFPLKPTLFFLVVSIIVLLAAFFYVPSKFPVNPSLSGIFKSYIKLLAVFLFFIIGYNLARIGLMSKLIRWFSIGALVIGCIGFIFTIFNINILSDLLFYASLRFRGMMNDPNYFAVLQITAMVYFVGSKDLGKVFRYLAVLILGLSVLISGSKTGILTLAVYVVFKVVENIFNTKVNFKTLIRGTIVVIFVLLIVPIILSEIDSLLITTSKYIPAFGRITVLFSDFNTAISGDGSGRAHAMDIGVELIKLSPIIGIGIGTYIGIAIQLWDYGSIAHNTYIQLAVEWGLPLTVLFFSYVAFLLIKISFKNKFIEDSNVIIRDMLIIFLISSTAISLNNARLFWLLLGVLVFVINVNYEKRKSA